MNFLKRKIVFVYNIIYAFLVKIYLVYCSLFFKKSATISKFDAEVVVSLTSYHKRFSSLKWTLESLIQQKTNYKYRLILVLSQEDLNIYGGKPKFLNSYEKRGLEVLIVNENLKSYKKAFYTYDMKLPLITTDDDIYYPSWWLQCLMSEYEKTPNMVLAYRGHYMVSKNNKILPYVEWMKWSENNYIEEEMFSLLPTGTSGILYPINSLKGLKDSKSKFLEICPHADDFWFKYITSINGVKSRRVLRENIHFPLMSRGESLFDINVVGGLNDNQFSNIIHENLDFKNKILSDIKKVGD